MNTEASVDSLANSLVEDLKPIRRVWPARLSGFLLFLISVLASSALVFIFFGYGSHLRLLSSHPVHLFSELLFLEIALLASMVLARERLPDLASTALTSWTTRILFFLLTGALLALSIFSRETIGQWSHDTQGAWCILRVLAVAIPILIGTFIFARQGAVTRNWRVGVLMGAFSVSVGAAAVPLFCSNESAMHIAVSHCLLPLLVASLLSLAAVPRIFRW